jgi:hypothetical protein
MPLHTAIWTVGDKPEPLPDASLASEALLEKMIVAEPRVLSDEWMLIGQQVKTAFNGRIDLLALAPDGSLVLIEIKRDRTPRDVVAQALDYASWISHLEGEEIASIYSGFRPGASLAKDFEARFGQPLDEASLNESHEIVIVAGSLDSDSERIVKYLGDRGIAINVLCFQIFQHGDQQLLSRTWLIDPTRAQATAAAAPRGVTEPWNGEFYVSFGEDDHQNRSWDDAVQYGFISAGFGSWYTRTLNLLSPGDRIWVKVPRHGFVGVGRVAGPMQSVKEFHVRTPAGEVPVLEAPLRAKYLRDLADDPERCEYFVPVKWLDTVRLADAVNEPGLFGNQNTVCRPATPKWRVTVERLKLRFPNVDAQ